MALLCGPVLVRLVLSHLALPCVGCFLVLGFCVCRSLALLGLRVSVPFAACLPGRVSGLDWVRPVLSCLVLLGPPRFVFAEVAKKNQRLRPYIRFRRGKKVARASFVLFYMKTKW